MPGRSPATSPLLVLALLLGLALSSPVGAAGPASVPDPSPGRTDPPVNLTGHWAAADLGSIDLVQDGTSLTGTSPQGVRLRGTIAGWRATFDFWEGPSYRKADKEDRGHGTIGVSSDGRLISVTWKTEAKSGKYNGTLTAVRVVLVGDSPDPAQQPMDAVAGEALLGALTGAMESLQAAVGAAAAADQATLSATQESAATSSQDEGPSLFQAAINMLQSTPAQETANYLSLMAATLKLQYERYDREATQAHQASKDAEDALTRAHEQVIGSRQDVRLYESRMKQAQAEAISADERVASAAVVLTRAQAAAAATEQEAETAELGWQATQRARLKAERRLADAGAGAPTSLGAALEEAVASENAAYVGYQDATERLEEIQAIVQGDLEAIRTLVQDAEDRHKEVGLWQASHEKATAAVPVALGGWVEAQADYLAKSTLAHTLTESARVTYISYDQVYWAARHAWETVKSEATVP